MNSQNSNLVFTVAEPKKASNLIPPRPVRPECMKIMRRTKSNWGEKEMGEEREYLAAYNEWEKKAAAVCRNTPSVSLKTLADAAFDEVFKWLKENGAPAEVLTAARHMLWLQGQHYLHPYGFTEVSDFHAAFIAEKVQDTRQAVKSLKDIRKSKAQCKKAKPAVAPVAFQVFTPNPAPIAAD